MIQCLIIEDDFAFALELKLMIENFGCHIVGIEKENQNIRHTLETRDIDVIVSDVKLGSGIFAFDYLRDIRNLPPVIFISSYDEDELYDQSMKLNPVLYLKKPIDKVTLRSAIENAIRSINKREDKGKSSNYDKILNLDSKVFIKYRGKMVSIDPREILYIHSEGNHCEIILKRTKYVVRSSIKNLISSINNEFLIQVHRGFVVNVNLITSFSIGKDEIYIENNTIPIGRTYKKAFKNMVKRSSPH